MTSGTTWSAGTPGPEDARAVLLGQAPAASSPEVLARFRSQRRRDTRHELAVRRQLHAAGVRYRVDVRVLPGSRVRPDLVWRGRRLAAFLDGCFWHACPEHQHWPKANAEWWRATIEANVLRDRRADALLGSLGWTVLRFWEHEDPAAVCEAIRSALAGIDRLAGDDRR